MSSAVLLLSVAVVMIVVGGAVLLRPRDARGDESVAITPRFLGPGQETTEGPGPTAQQTKEALESSRTGQPDQTPKTDPQAARELPHQDLGREEALELAEGVFGAELEAPAGIYDELEAKKFLTNYAAVVPSSSLPEQSVSEGPDYGPEPPQGDSVLLESTLPLRTENPQGEEEAIDLTLQSAEGSGGGLEPTNPLTEVELPAQLGEGITLPGPEVGIDVAGAPEGVAPSDVEGQYAFYPNVAEDTDLAVAPTATGVELTTDIRSAAAPMSTTYELSLPLGASLAPGPGGGAEVIEEGRRAAVVTPPSATDAAGNPVEASMQIEGERLVVSVSPGPTAEFPILVDPEYLSEEWKWTSSNSSQAAWTGSTNDAAFQPVPYAFWEAHGAPGLDLASGGWAGGEYGKHADWVYTVPRYNQDITKFGTPPTSWITSFYAENMWWLNNGEPSNYPMWVLGLADPGSGGFWSTWSVYYGASPFVAQSAWFLNTTNDTNTKAIDSDLITYENESLARTRNAYIGGAFVAIIDKDAPKILSLTAPSGWLSGTSAQAIGYGFEDTGLGVYSAIVRLPGESGFKWLAAFGCSGATASPCPRKPLSSESGRPKLPFAPSELPTGKDQLEVAVGDPFWGAGHEATGTVTVDIDNTPPEVELSGPLTEQESLGTLKSEYPLTIKATDGTASDPQSGVAKVEVKVDGKTKSTWTPGCASENCSFSGAWTLKSSEYTAASHEVEVLVTDAAGVVSENAIEVDLGEAPPQTSFTSPHPRFEANELSSISFKATKGGAPVVGATFRCSLDGAAASACSSPYGLPGHFEDGPHIFTVAAIDKSGKADPTPATWRFETGAYPAAPSPSEKLVYPEEGKKTASYYTLEAEWGGNPEGKSAEGVTGVTFEMELPGWTSFKPVPEGCVVDGQGRSVSWPIKAKTHPGHNAPVYLKVRGCPVFETAGYPEAEIKFRATFDGTAKVAGASPAAVTEFVSRYNANRVSTDAIETVGPASVDLLTGAFSLSRTDVSIPVPGYEANLEFTRTYNSTIDKSLPGYSLVMGGAWQPASPLETEGEGEVDAWTRVEEKVIPSHPEVKGYYCWEYKPEVKEVEGEEVEEEVEFEKQCPGGVEYNCPEEWCESWVEEEAQPRESWIELIDSEGAGVPFEISASGQYVSPEWAKELVLHPEGENIVLAYPSGTHIIFTGGGPVSEKGRKWLPHSISFQANSQSTRMIYATEAGSKAMRLEAEVAPSPVTCPDEAQHTPGCRMLKLNYSGFLETGLCSFTWAQFEQHGEACPSTLQSIQYFGPSGNGVGQTVASYEYVTIPTGFTGKSERVLASESDPRTGLAEKYSYEQSSFRLSTLTPPGQTPWEFSYLPAETSEMGSTRKLKSASRGGATTTLAYQVPVEGAGAPYDLSPANISRWGETDLPVDATAIFPPNHLPTEYPPHTFTGATIDYMDPEGSEVNTASPSPPGVSGPSITTTETDAKGNVVRELSARNRLLALESPESAAISHQLDSHSVYNAAGTELLESWEPQHQVRLESSGESVEARQHTIIRYDEEEPTPPAGTPPAYLPTKETVAAVVSGKSGEFDPTATVTKYEWAHRLPEETIVDPGGLNLRSVTKYNPQGQVEETRQPKGAAGGTAGDTKTVYYSATGTGECAGSPRYAGLPCKVLPAKQETGSGRPELLVKKYITYNELGEPTEILESPGGGSSNVRKTVTEYDESGRQVSTKTTGAGVAPARTEAKTETVYSSTGYPTEQKFVCEATNCTGFDSQATKVTYDALGQVTEYEDADGAKTKTTYDPFGRPATITDPRGTETMHYDELSGALTSLEVSGVGTFTAAYDADGDLIRRGLPNGLTTTTTYNVADEPTKLSYTKTSSCGASCSWYEESLERSIEGRILADAGSMVSNRYSYDKAGRLTEATETPTLGKKCTSRSYKYDPDSNRLSKTTRESAIEGPCPPSGGTVQSYEYDGADRLMGPTYDAWGRITNLPAADAGGKELVTSYFSTNMVATQAQNGVTNTFQLDASGRQRAREQAGGVAGLEIFHYDGASDSLGWSELGATWSRNITGIGGELAAVQESSGTTTFKLTDLHGDVIASASSSPTATKLLAEYRSDEFGEPVFGGSAGRFGWLGGKSRRTELSSGVIQMGARSYIPALGRFLTPDPMPGGSANAYDYANQDPVNGFDLDGNCPSKKKCAKQIKKAMAKAHKAVSHFVHAAKKVLVHAAAHFQHEVVHQLRVGITFHLPPLEHLISSAETFAYSQLGVSDNTCAEKAGEWTIIGGAFTLGGVAIGPESFLGKLAITAGQALLGVGVAQVGAHKSGHC